MAHYVLMYIITKRLPGKFDSFSLPVPAGPYPPPPQPPSPRCQEYLFSHLPPALEIVILKFYKSDRYKRRSPFNLSVFFS